MNVKTDTENVLHYFYVDINAFPFKCSFVVLRCDKQKLWEEIACLP
jgi:hypothetical protein